MKKPAFNPYLPGNEYIPDGEPYVFEDRVYVYGSHDRFNGKIFCLNDYVCWSAPVEDLSDWRYEGVIYRKKQDPRNPMGLRLLFAPDVVQGPDGRFYLYYAFDFMGLMGVAVCDTPAGNYEFLGHVRYEDGKLWGRKKGDSLPFDPGVLNDEDGRIFLYSGFYFDIPPFMTGMKKLKTGGGYVLELHQDMVTIKKPEKLLFPKEGEGSFPDHEFFEASSIRKIKGKYYFVYSSRHNHELCYALSDKPDSGFVFGGTLVSNGDIFLEDREETDALNYIGNNHGGILELRGEYYIFYHRHTNRTSYSRQACAEKLEMLPEGIFKQAEMTSCGLNGGPLPGQGTFEARIACNIWSSAGTGRYDVKRARKKFADHPYFTQDGSDKAENSKQYIANMKDGSVAGFKYFQIENTERIVISIAGNGKGEFLIFSDTDLHHPVANVPIDCNSKDFKEFQSVLNINSGIHPLYFQYKGSGAIAFSAFTLK